MQTIGDRLRYVINSKNITPYELSREIGVSQATFSRILSGSTQKPSRKVINMLADYLHISRDWLMSGEGEMLKQESNVTFVAEWGGFVNALVETKDSLSDILQEQKEIIHQLRNIITDKDQTINTLRSEIEKLKK